MQIEPPHCLHCDSLLVPEYSSDTQELHGFLCHNRDCDLKGLTQRQDDGETVGFGSDGTVTRLQRGKTSVNEGNLDVVRIRLKRHIPSRYDVRVLDEGEPEEGIDLVAQCVDCCSKHEMQVVRSISQHIAKHTSRYPNEASEQGNTSELFKPAWDNIAKKTKRYPLQLRATRILVIDADVTTFWTAMANQDRLEEYTDGLGWSKVIFIGPTSIIPTSFSLDCQFLAQLKQVHSVR